ncbi:MAG: RidA family protein [Cyclobacteriaceae bacterium]
MKSIKKYQLLLLSLLLACQPKDQTLSIEPQEVVLYDNPSSSILRGFELPADKKLFITSGLVSLANDTTREEKTLERYGDTYTQSIGCLKRIEGLLKEAGLKMSDVVFLRVYVAPDPNNEDQHDFQGWFDAYGKFFNNDQNPSKVARSTIGVAALARPYLLVEVEAVAVYK